MSDNSRVMDAPDVAYIRDFMYIAFKMIKNCHFKGLEDIDLSNLRAFLSEALIGYKNKEIQDVDLLSITDALETYLHRRYMDDYPETLYPYLPAADPLSIGVDAIDYIHDAVSYVNLPSEMIEELLVFLQTPLGKEIEGHQRIRDYLIAKGVLSKEHLNL